MIERNQSKSNARGGARQGAGRKAGSTTKKTREIAERAMADGDLTPLEYMLKVMRTEPSPEMEPRELMAAFMLRFEAAKAAAPYMHPRLAAIEHTGPNGGPIAAVTATMNAEEFEQIAKKIADEV